jgi:predicted Zn-dependent peptidase
MKARSTDPTAFESFRLPWGAGLHVNSSPKQKTVLVKLDITANLDATVTRRALVPMVLRRGTSRLPDMKAVHRHLESLYGASLSTDVAKVGEYHVVKMRLEFVNDRFLPGGGSIAREAVSFLREVLLEPRLACGSFEPEYVEQEKNNLRRTIESLIDDKGHYALERCIREMCAGEEYRRYELGDAADLPGIDAPGLTTAWREWAFACPADIHVSGDIDVEAVRALFEDVFREAHPGGYRLAPLPAPAPVGEPRTVEERMDVNQARLVLGFRHGITYTQGDLEALVMMNGVLGGFSHSKLFQNVREKASLAYDAHSGVEKTKGLLFIQCGIAPENFRRALDICLAQVDALRAADVSEEELLATRESFLQSLTMVEDSPGDLMEIDSVWRLHGREFDLRAYRKRLAAVDRERIAAAAAGVKLDTVYFLRS